MTRISSGSKWEAPINTLAKVSLLLSVLAASLSAMAQLAPPEQWQSELLRDHELVGQIWSSGDQAFITPDELAGRITSARYLLLGEKHDNADHHALQLATLEFLLDRNQVHSVAFEMMDETIMGYSSNGWGLLYEYLWSECE